ncbi:MAG TPA: FecR domain-containing protein [Alphaproteobacteria bacterium]|jgi:hypothetical protein
MKKRTRVPLTVLGAASALALAAGAAPAEAQTGTKAGVAAAVKGAVQQVSFRTPAANVGRNVASGDEIFLGDRIVTGPAGGLQIMLLDGTTFSIGPNSSMVIDEFVYNPATGTGKITASVARGTLRLISGRIARQEQEAIQIKLPVATVGIRGSMVVFSGGPNGFFIGLFGVGPDNSADRPQSLVTVLINGTLYEIFRTGWGCTVSPSDPTCNPQPVGPDFLQQLLGQIGGQLRFIDLTEFERQTGLDLVSALNLMGKPGGFDELMQLITDVIQDRFRPPEFTPPPSPPSSYPIP